MKKQQSFSDIEFNTKKRQTRKEIFLNAMEDLIPWQEWIALIEPFYAKAGNGRRPIPLETMLRMYLVQVWFNLSDELTEDSIYDSQSIRQFVGINLSEENAPDATTLLRFRHLLEERGLTKAMFEAIKAALLHNGYMMKEGTIVDATIIQAPSSAKNADKSRDPEMKSTKKGNNFYFGMKSHIGVDKSSGFVHTVEVTAANAHDITMASALLHGEEHELYGDAGYIGVEKREEFQGKEDIAFIINLRKGKVRGIADIVQKARVQAEERAKSSVRSKVEKPFHIIKNLFKFKKTNYHGLQKNGSKLYMLYALANLYLCKWKGFSLRPQN